MKTWLRKIGFIVAAAFILSEVSLANASSVGDSSKSWKFEVWLDDTPIGYHQVSVNREENRKTVHTRANFDVRILFIPVYSYEHETREQWENGCLTNITSTTDDNGDGYFISTLQNDERLHLETHDGVTALDGCIRTFAYWDIDLLNSGSLLNTQTGEYQQAAITDMGIGSLQVDEEQIEARHFRLVVENMTIDLWYTDDMHWLALESVTESGAVLRYLPQTLADYAMSTRS